MNTYLSNVITPHQVFHLLIHAENKGVASLIVYKYLLSLDIHECKPLYFKLIPRQDLILFKTQYKYSDELIELDGNY